MMQPVGHGYAVKCDGCPTMGPTDPDVWEAEQKAIGAGFVVTRKRPGVPGRDKWTERDDCAACAAKATAPPA